MKTLDEFQAEVGAWGDTTFPKSNWLTVLNHFEEEAGELIETRLAVNGEPHTFPPSLSAVAEEAADCFILLMQFAHKTDFSLYDAAERKMAINRARAWKTTLEPGGHIKHVEGAGDE